MSSLRRYVAVAHILTQVSDERERQDQLKQAGRFRYTPNEVPLIRGHAMLSEEGGEVAECIMSLLLQTPALAKAIGEVGRSALAVSGYVQEDLTLDDVRKELIQVAAIAVAMVQGIDEGTATTKAS